ncbi:MAG: heterodisulfide reductase-related iron-sulfur binding cluster [Anaerolineae bacterium]
MPRLPVWFLMPDPQPKRARLAEQLTSPHRVAPPLDEEALRDRLRAIRDDTAEHLDDLLGQLASTLREQYGITPLEATTAQEAADEIARLAGPSRRVLVNRSATVAELLPHLEAHGLEVVETYDGQFSHPDQGVERYWQLELPSAEAAWEAFHPQSIHISPKQSTDIGVLGVNVIAAEDGTVYFVQHLFNISEILEQASQVVLVIGVERVVRDRDAAMFVARAQARYGVLSIALGVPRRGGDSKGELPAGRGLIPSPPARDVQHAPMHVILLDNGRRAWLSDPRYRDLFLCIGCRSCLLECPAQPYFGRETGWTPRDYLTAFLRGDNPSLRECITCGRCRARCPLDIDLPAMISEAKAEAGATRWQDQFYCNLGLLFQGSSLIAPLSNWLFNWPLARLPMEWVAGMDRERKLPRFHRDTFLNQYHRRSSSPTSDRMVLYYPGCYVNFTDPELGWAVVGILERNGFRVLVPKHLCCGVACFPYGAKELGRRYARQALKVFGPLAREGYTILVSCPSCGTALERDFPYLLPESDDARLVAEQTQDVSDFLWALHQQGELDTDFDPLEMRVGYHTPCHLRVRSLGPENLRLLSLVPGIEPVDIDRGCCGLAGSFGMRRAHREESREMGRYLFQELQSPDYDLGVTNCAGCEMQMRAGSGREVVHPLKLLWRAYSKRSK